MFSALKVLFLKKKNTPKKEKGNQIANIRMLKKKINRHVVAFLGSK